MTDDHARNATSNRLATSTSPYLRQHAGNPVDWYAWGPEALATAKRDDKPILLSVGYSSCHWCHVMAHESFEDPAIAAVMNEHFVNIKVDREERPDIDAIYQRVVQLMGEGGGWPLTVFLTPDQHPFYGGTYFPPASKYGRPGFPQVLQTLSDLYRNDKAKIASQVEAFTEGFAQLAATIDEEAEHASGDPGLEDPAALRVAARRLLTKIDPEFGGFGRAPKFPNPTALEIFALLSRGEGPVADDAGVALFAVLDAMHRGGIYDHLRGGFARYSVDRVWLVPHFEKMLYDNALLLPLYAEAAVRWPEHQGFRDVVRETIAYLAADLRTADGTFYAATDADSEGVEGKYFCWTPAQLREVLADHALAELVCAVYDVTPDGNFEHGWSILHLPRAIASRAEELGRELPELSAALDTARATLLRHRYTRIPPHRDDKILTAWNALLVSGLIRAASASTTFGDEALAKQSGELATQCLDHLLAHHIDAQGRVQRAAFEGAVHTRGFIEDVAYLGRACLDAHELTLSPRYLDTAASLAAHALAHYRRPGGDGFVLSADDGEPLIERPEAHHDGPIPSGVGVMLELLARLSAADRAPARAQQVVAGILARFAGALVQPFGYASVLTAACHVRPDAVHVTVRGPQADATVVQLAAVVRSARLRMPVAVSLSWAQDDEPAAIVCRGQVCTAPLTTIEALRDALR